jgi:hypothetical protein
MKRPFSALEKRQQLIVLFGLIRKSDQLQYKILYERETLLAQNKIKFELRRN